MRKISLLIAINFIIFGINAQVFITELADPNNNADVRYIELYNAGGSEVDFTENSGWRIDKYTNESEDVSQTLNLTGTIPAGGFYIIATGTDDGDFFNVYGVPANQFDGVSNNVAGGNGDDKLELYDGDNTLIDAFGIPGEEDTEYEFENGRAERNTGTTSGNDTWTFSEWTISSPQDAPAGFDPRAWIDATPIKSVFWKRTDFVENTSNDGSINNTIDLILINETFSPSGTLTANTHYTVANLPSGLTLSIEASSTTVATITLTGNATNHANTNDISNLTISFLNAAFTGGDASTVSDASKNTSINFYDILSDIIITEINYNNPGVDLLEYVEIYNNGAVTLNLEDCYFSGFTYVFGDIDIEADEHIIVAVNSEEITNVYSVDSHQWTSGSLLNGGESIVLYNSFGSEIDRVDYTNDASWGNADGSGHSLVLCDYNSDNNDAANWTISTNYIGEDGEGNKIWGSPTSIDNICTTNPSIAWGSSTFSESDDNDGTINNDDSPIELTLTDDEFAKTEDLVLNTDYTVANVPDGLAVVINVSSTTEATIALEGTATQHADADDISNMEITFSDDAFVSGFASNVTNNSNTAMSVDFDDNSTKELTWNQSAFNEAAANDGSIDNTISVTLSNETFVTVGTLTINVDYVVENVPAGLSIDVTTTSTTEATISLTGTATAHESANNVSDLEVTFTDDAFTGADAITVTNSSKSDLEINFADVAVLTWNQSEFNEANANNGTIDNSISATLTNKTFSIVDLLVENTHYTVANVPAGLTVVISTSSTTSATISLTGTATAHENANDVADLTITFLDAAFTGENAIAVTNYTKTDLAINYTDAGILTWNQSEFEEASANNGSIDNSITATLTNKTFSIVDLLVENTHYTVADVPAGLTVAISTSSTTSATISLTGNATAHANANDVADLTITFLDAAFTGGNAEEVANYSKTDIVVDFIDEPIPELTWNQSVFNEASANNGTIDNTISVSLLNETFTSVGAFTETTHYTVANVPSGLSVGITTTSTTEATITLTGTAAAHENANDVSDLTITFSDAAFTSGSASDVTGYSKTDLEINFNDVPTKTLTWNETVFSEVSANDGSIDNTISATLTNETFVTTGDLTVNTHYYVSNIPTGLSVKITTTDVNNFTVSLIGNASNNDNSDDVNDFTIVFKDAAFTENSASSVQNSSKTDLKIDFDENVAINDINKEKGYNIYPNPNSGLFFIEGKQISKIEIFNTSGKLIYTSNKNNKQINISENKKGLYFIKIHQNNTIITEKIIIK